MKQSITISLIILVAVGLGYYLFKISPQSPDYSNITPLLEPSALKADDHILGNPAAKNTAIIFEDLQCPACKAFSSIAEQIPEKFIDTKLVFRHFPLTNNHKNALVAALASEAAADQGKFWEFVKLAYEKQNEWNQLADPSDKFAEISQAAGVSNVEQFKSDLSGQKYMERVQRDLKEALGLKVPGTPTLYFNNKILELGSIDSLKKQAEPLYIK